MLSHIKRIEIELHSHCNRNCAWCPNKDIDRSFYKELPEETYIKLLNELKVQNFGADCHTFSKNGYEPIYITFNRFCEPMFNTELLKTRVNQARSILGRVLYSVNTNGDFLSKENLADLHLDSLLIMDYDFIGKANATEVLRQCDVLILDEINVDDVVYGTHKSITKVNYFYNWVERAEIEDRAGYLKEDITFNVNGVVKTMDWKDEKNVRTYPCIEPQNYISIDYNGDVTPCCHIRADIEEHKQYVFGNIKEQNLVDIINSEKWLEFQRIMISPEWENYPEVCRYCQKRRYLGYNNE